MNIGDNVYCILKSEENRLVIFQLVVISFDEECVCCMKGDFDDIGIKSEIVFIERIKLFDCMGDANEYVLELEEKVKQILLDERIEQKNLFSKKVDVEIS